MKKIDIAEATIKSAQAGDQRATADIYKMMLPVIQMEVKKMGNKVPYSVWEDLWSEAAVGFMLALKSYNQEKGASLYTWVSRKINWQLCNFIKGENTNKAKNNRNMCSIDTLSYPGKDVVGEEDESEDTLAMSKIKSAISKLPPRERTAFIMRAEGYTFGDIGKRLGVSKQRADQINGKAIAKLRRRLKKIQ